ncbi:MAG: phage tail protein, partial [Opitutaceae bacterium]|nr:phage tail protein [Opitutaceae bacterium]
MGSSNKPSPAPSPANIESDDYSTNQEAQPLRWFVGTARCPLTWLTEIHNLRRVPIYHSAKKTSVKIGDKIFGDIAGAACLGPIHAIRAIEVDNEIIWEGNITVPDTFGGGTGVTGDNGVPPSPTPPANNTPANNRATIATDRGTFYIYYGNAWQPLDDILLAPVSAAFPDLAHPAYRGQCYCVCKNFYFGDSRNTVPNVTLLLERYPQTTMINSDTSGSLRPPLSDGGCTPAAAVLDLLISSLYGLGVSRETLGISGNYSSGSGTWWLAQNQYKAVTLSYDGYPSKLLAIAPSIDRTQPASDLLRSLLEIYQQAVTIDKNGTLVWKGNPYQKSLYLHQFVEKPALTQNSPDLAPTQVTVKFSDSTRNFKETSVTLTKPSPNSIIPLPTKKDLSLPALLTQESARTLAAHYLAQTNFGDASLSLKIRHTHSYDYEWYSGSYNSNPPLLPGDLVLGRFIEPPEGVSQNYKNNQATLWRITRREDEYEGDVTLTAVPNPPYERVRPCVDEAAILPELFPTPVANATILDLPPSLRQSSDNQAAIIILAERPPAQYAGTDVTTSFVSSFILHHAPLTAPNAFAAIGEYANWSLRA